MARLDLHIWVRDTDIEFTVRDAPAVPRKGEGFRYMGVNYEVHYVGWGFSVTKKSGGWEPIHDQMVAAVELRSADTEESEKEDDYQ